MSAAEALILERPRTIPQVEYFDSKLKDRQTVRWLFFGGDLIAKRRKQEIDWLRVGGMEVDSRCIHRWGDKFIPRAYAAIVEEGANLMPMEHLRNVGAQVWTGVKVEGQVIDTQGGLGFTVTYPGDATMNLISRAHNDHGMRNGLTELTSLIGHSWRELHQPDGSGFLDRVESACFGDGQQVTLRGLEEQITFGTAEVEQKFQFPVDIGKYRDEALQSCSEFRDWGMIRLEEEHANVRQGSTKEGLVYRYSPIGELLLTQLEVIRQDRSAVEQLRQQIHSFSTGEAAPPAFNANELVELGRKLAMAEAEVARLKQEQAEPKEHWKTREARLRKEAEAAV